MAPLWQGLDSHSSISVSQLTPGGGGENKEVSGESTVPVVYCAVKCSVTLLQIKHTGTATCVYSGLYTLDK